MRYFDEQLVANSRPHQQWWGELCANREVFHRREDDLSEIMANAMRAAGVPLANNAAVLPRDAWQEMDTITMRVLRGDDGSAFMSDLMSLARPIHIGKLALIDRVSSDAGQVKRSLSGQVATPMGKVDYDYRGTIVPLFHTAYGREWREWNTLQSEGFDALFDDQEAHLHKLMADQAEYALDGDATLSLGGYTGWGIRTNPLSKSINLGAGGANIDLADPTTTSDDIDTFFTYTFGAMLDANEITGAVNLYVSREIGRNFDRSYSGASGFKGGRLVDYLLTNRRINKIVVTNKLTGNEFFGFVPDSRYIRPLIGLATSTHANVRLNPTDNYQFSVMAALGLQIRADFNGKSGVFYSVEL